jgi:hypothetical protein
MSIHTDTASKPKRLRLWFFLGMITTVLLLLLSPFSPLGHPQAHRVTPRNYSRLAQGMSAEEIIGILGVPAGDYTTRPYERPSRLDFSRSMPRAIGKPWLREERKDPMAAPRITKKWRVDGAELIVVFERGRLSSAEYLMLVRRAETLPEMLRRWLRL